jgi:hypothetical protein
MPLAVQVDVNVMWIPAGSGNTFLEQSQAQIAGQGQLTGPSQPSLGLGPGQLAHVGRVAQRRLYIDFEAIPIAAGSENTVTLANINTAVVAAANAISGAGSPLITPAELAIIQNWATGGT